jgi:DNA invertase Pin-like site-specific DNA recombinase
VFVDAAVSGSLAIEDRLMLMQAVTALQRGDVLLVAKRDRLGRDFIEVALTERLVLKRGARVVSAAGEGTDNDDPSSVLTRHMLDIFAEHERALVSARTKAALAVKRARGERLGTIPLGYQLAPHSKEHLVPAPAEQRLLARMRTLRDGGLTYRQIQEALRLEGWTTRRGTPMRFQYVARALKVQAS